MCQGRGVCVLNKVSQRNGAFASPANTMHLGRKSGKNSRPVAAGVGFRQRAANRPAVAHLDVGNSRGTVMENGNLRSRGGCLDFRVPGQSAEVKRAIVFLDVGRTAYEVQIHKVSRVREP